MGKLKREKMIHPPPSPTPPRVIRFSEDDCDVCSSIADTATRLLNNRNWCQYLVEHEISNNIIALQKIAAKQASVDNQFKKSATVTTSPPKRKKTKKKKRSNSILSNIKKISTTNDNSDAAARHN